MVMKIATESGQETVKGGRVTRVVSHEGAVEQRGLDGR